MLVKRKEKAPPPRGSHTVVWPSFDLEIMSVLFDSGPWWYVYTFGPCSGKFASCKGGSLGLIGVGSPRKGERERSIDPIARAGASKVMPSDAMCALDKAN